jgi:plastocyanin
MRWFSLILVSLLLALLAAAGGLRRTIHIKDMRYDPASLEIKVGDRVVWKNEDDRDHTVVARDGSFDSDNIRSGESFSYQFTKPGKFAYSCRYHPRMRGVVSVGD